MKPVGALLGEFLREVAKDEEVALIFLREMWPRIVGPELARETRPVALSKKSLVVAAATESWQKEVTRIRRLLVESINRFWAVRLVERIRVKTHLTQDEANWGQTGGGPIGL
jgi:predicted nucleic acid-binding Zn ribbon protein